MCTFEQYLRTLCVGFQQMQKIHGELLKEIGDDPEAVELYEDLIDAANRYAGIVQSGFGCRKKKKWIRIH